MCLLLPRVQKQQSQLHKELLRELFLLPGFIYNYMAYFCANYLRNFDNFLYCLYMRNVSGESSKWALCTRTNLPRKSLKVLPL